MSNSVTPWTVGPQTPLVHGVLQARILECVAMPFSRGSPRPRDRTWVSHIVGRFFTVWATSILKKIWKIVFDAMTVILKQCNRILPLSVPRQAHEPCCQGAGFSLSIGLILPFLPPLPSQLEILITRGLKKMRPWPSGGGEKTGR